MNATSSPRYTTSMNKNLTIGLALVLLTLLLGAAGVWAFSDKGTGFLGMGPAPIATTTPGGTGAPTTTTPSGEQERTTTALGERIYKFGVHITPIEVLEDSRCPTGVQCVWAGQVRLKAKLEDGTRTQIVTFVTGSPISFGNKHVTLMSVAPAKSQKPIAAGDYRFTFSVAYGMGGDEVATGTLSGTMTIGPICPVENVDNPCKPTAQMYAARKVAVYKADQQTLVTILTPNASGAFSASLPAGTYYVAMATPQPKIGGATGVPATIVIIDGVTTKLAIDIDTGIR